MKFMLMTYGTQEDYDGMAGKSTGKPAWTPEQFQAMVEFITALNKKLEDSGVLVETRGLDLPVHTRRVTHDNGENVVTDGPYAETQEVLAGYWVVDCDGIEQATEIAMELSNCPGPEHVQNGAYIDIRPINDSADELL
ncbi:hypothetical protein Afil01_63840 [Actinorhabdospora filicis]|uniref:YCII-related domain-containing protein n=1 Tax=Actinorhabdospora filicis TaxID=1785913 RepID=A0A9W6W6I3_9ACTN|nr:YciI family protein [Actinorhabdospora filicis]GLZ81577.1 hypothetical protein Afil01_63840 [Actinorhabdospora filicis]